MPINYLYILIEPQTKYLTVFKNVFVLNKKLVNKNVCIFNLILLL